jgi:hypothetical protein
MGRAGPVDQPADDGQCVFEKGQRGRVTRSPM